MNIRIPETLKAMLERAAQLSKQSVSAEIVERLEASFPENVLQTLIARRQEELRSIESQVDHLEWRLQIQEQENNVGRAAETKIHLHYLRHQALQLMNQIKRLEGSTPISQGR